MTLLIPKINFSARVTRGISYQEKRSSVRKKKSPREKLKSQQQVVFQVPQKQLRLAEQSIKEAYHQLPEWLRNLLHQTRLRFETKRTISSGIPFGENFELTNRIIIYPAQVHPLTGQMEPLTKRAIKRTIWHEIGHKADSLPVITSALFEPNPKMLEGTLARYPNMLKYLPSREQRDQYPSLRKINTLCQGDKYPERLSELPWVKAVYEQDCKQLKKVYPNGIHPDLDERVDRSELFAYVYSQAFKHPHQLMKPEEQYEEAVEQAALRIYPRTTKLCKQLIRELKLAPVERNFSG